MAAKKDPVPLLVFNGFRSNKWSVCHRLETQQRRLLKETRASEDVVCEYSHTVIQSATTYQYLNTLNHERFQILLKEQ